VKNHYKASLRGPKGRGDLLRYVRKSHRTVWDCFAFPKGHLTVRSKWQTLAWLYQKVQNNKFGQLQKGDLKKQSQC